MHRDQEHDAKCKYSKRNEEVTVGEDGRDESAVGHGPSAQTLVAREYGVKITEVGPGLSKLRGGNAGDALKVGRKRDLAKARSGKQVANGLALPASDFENKGATG